MNTKKSSLRRRPPWHRIAGVLSLYYTSTAASGCTTDSLEESIPAVSSSGGTVSTSVAGATDGSALTGPDGSTRGGGSGPTSATAASSADGTMTAGDGPMTAPGTGSEGPMSPLRETIMPFGDSTTSAYEGQHPYRYYLYYLLEDAGFRFDFVGSHQGHSDTHDFGERVIWPDMDHEGHKGWRSRFVHDGDVRDWAEQSRPDIVLMHVGTADGIKTADDRQRYLENMTLVIEIFREANPQVAILWAQIIPMEQKYEDIQALNALIPEAALELSTDESPVIVVDQWTGYELGEDTCCSTWHPNDRGHEKMALRWFDALEPLLRTE